MWCVCAQSYMVESKNIFDHFICFWKWFLSLFVFMFSVYFVFHCLNMFCIEKNRCQSFSRLRWRLASHETPAASSSRRFWQLTRGLLVTHSRLTKIFATKSRDLPSCETPRNNLLKGSLWETYFKPLSSSFKHLFYYFYIKT